MGNLHLDKVFFMDCETLGLNIHLHPMWEIALIIEDVEYVWQQRVTPQQIAAASPVALEITKFHDRYDHDSALSVEESLDRFMGLVWRGEDSKDKLHWVGAVPSFDEFHIRYAYNEYVDPKRDEWPWHHHLIDVEPLMIGWLQRMQRSYDESVPPKVWFELPMPWDSHWLSEFMGVVVPKETEHEALADTRWARDCWIKIFE